MSNFSSKISKVSEVSQYTITEVMMRGAVKPPCLLIREIKIDGIKPGEAFIKVEASCISFAEQALRRDR